MKFNSILLILLILNISFADSIKTYTQAEVNAMLNKQSTLKDTTIIGPTQPQTIIIQQQQTNNGYNYGWNTWSDGGKAAFIISMVILTTAAIIVPVVIANSYSDSYYY